MSDNRHLLAGALGLTILLAACGGSATPSASSAAATSAPAATDGAATAAPEATEGQEATEAPAETDDSGTIATVPPEALNDLAASMPENANGIAYQRAGYNGDQFGMFGSMVGLDDAQLNAILSKHGKTAKDMNFAIASPANSADSKGGMVFAIQVEGVDASEWIGELGSMPTDKKTTVGGKDVYGQAAGGFGIFVYPKGDTMYMLLLMDEKQAGSILEQLP